MQLCQQLMFITDSHGAESRDLIKAQEDCVKMKYQRPEVGKWATRQSLGSTHSKNGWVIIGQASRQRMVPKEWLGKVDGRFALRDKFDKKSFLKSNWNEKDHDKARWMEQKRRYLVEITIGRRHRIS